MTSAGVGVAVHLDGFTAAGLAAHRALTAAGRTPRSRSPWSSRARGTTTTSTRRALGGAAHHPQRAHHRLLGDGRAHRRRRGRERHGGRGAGARRPAAADADLLARRARRAARGGGAARARGAARRWAGTRPARRSRCWSIRRSSTRPTSWPGSPTSAPDLLITGAGASGGESGCRVFWKDAAQADACVALVFPPELHPSMGMTQGCQAVGDPQTITAAEGNLILEIDGRPAVEALEKTLSNPKQPGLRQMTQHLLAGIGELGAGGRSDYVVRPFAIADSDRPALAVAEPVRAGQTICFTLRDAIGARDDMKAMLDEQADARDIDAALRRLLQLRRARQRALRPGRARSRADPAALRRAAGRRDRELLRDRPDVRPPAHPHVHGRPAARRLARAGGLGNSSMLSSPGGELCSPELSRGRAVREPS